MELKDFLKLSMETINKFVDESDMIQFEIPVMPDREGNIIVVTPDTENASKIMFKVIKK